MGMVQVYVIEFECGSLYVGLTRNLPRRMEEHQRRQSPSTRRFPGGFKLIYPRAFESYAQARQHEKLLKARARNQTYCRTLRFTPTADVNPIPGGAFYDPFIMQNIYFGYIRYTQYELGTFQAGT
jgi:predicted GIY-YIG superfamily endonuclease